MKAVIFQHIHLQVITGKVLIFLSDASTFVAEKNGNVSQEETGVFLQELTKPSRLCNGSSHVLQFSSVLLNYAHVCSLLLPRAKVRTLALSHNRRWQ